MTIMIDELVDLLGALRSRSTRRSRCWAENHQQLPVGVREAAEIMAAIESTGGARAAVDCPDARRRRALRGLRVSGAVDAAARGAWAASQQVWLRPDIETVGA